uniref:MIF4G domain-containing protein n=1 Tax=Globodera pallida TaxID=36090 RepID=A0A183C443_GLOPA
MASEIDHSPTSSIDDSNNSGKGTSSRNAVSSESTRNRRFLANLQSSLGGVGKSNNLSPKRRNRTSNFGKDCLPTEEICSLEEALRLITLSGDDVCASLMDIKPFLQCKSATFKTDEFDKIASALCDAALQHSNIYFVVDICFVLIEFVAFQQAMSDCLKRKTAEFLRDDEGESANVPHFLAQLLVARWPRKFNREETIDPDIEAIFERCTRGMISFCYTGQRFLWLNFPELYDKIFNAIVELLTGNTKLSGSAKCSLLHLHISMNKWSLANLPKYSNAQTQTVNTFF